MGPILGTSPDFLFDVIAVEVSEAKLVELDELVSCGFVRKTTDLENVPVFVRPLIDTV